MQQAEQAAGPPFNMNMIETKAGLPNTCWQCGSEPGETWYAANEDAARSGKGKCGNCAFPKAPMTEVAPAAPGSVITGGQPADDFTRIKGIGPARAAELQQLGLTTFIELATAEHEGLVIAMEANPKVITMWQSQAGRLANEALAAVEAEADG